MGYMCNVLKNTKQNRPISNVKDRTADKEEIFKFIFFFEK